MDSVFNELIIGLLVGIVSGLITAEIYHYFSSYRDIWKERAFYKPFKGWWIERIEGQEERKFSFAEFKFDKETKSYQYEGKNFYGKDGKLYYRWDSVRLFRDKQKKKILYIYTTTKDGYDSKEGFGVMYYSYENSVFTNGYFLDATDPKDLNTQSKPRKLKICRIESIAKELNFDLNDYSSNVLSKFTIRLEEWEKENGKSITTIANKT